jgi:hypothetical protein
MHPWKPFAIPADWSPEQAMAVLDLLDELREHIAARYALQLTEVYRAHYWPESDAADTRPPIGNDEPF